MKGGVRLFVYVRREMFRIVLHDARRIVVTRPQSLKGLVAAVKFSMLPNARGPRCIISGLRLFKIRTQKKKQFQRIHKIKFYEESHACHWLLGKLSMID